MNNKNKLLIAGVDEVGRGPLAGPVVTAAVILKTELSGLDDSKKLSPKKREALAEQIIESALCYAYGRAEVAEIDTLNIHHATLLAMQRAILALAVEPDEVMIDGLYAPQLTLPVTTVIKGDSLVPCISAASILAKVLRDKEMEAMDLLYPGYGFAEHKGYGTPRHKAALLTLGASPIHRRSFSPVSECLTV